LSYKEIYYKLLVIEKGTGNIEFLAKLLIIRQKFPNEYKDIEEKALREALTWEEIESNPNIISSKNKGLEKFKAFISEQWDNNLKKE